jgi:phage/plasmid-like protein (TIGR03299 family)
MHHIDFSRGRANIAYKGETPWHGLGEQLPENQSIEVWQKSAGLDWELLKLPVEYEIGEDRYAYKNRVVLVRSDTCQPLGVTSDSHFKIVQPSQVLEFYRDLVEKHGYSLETAGSLKGGARVWALANVGKTFRAGKDNLKSYLLLATGMDGKFSTTCKLTSVRVVCNNTLTMAIPEAGKKSHFKDVDQGVIRISHSSEFDAETVKIDLGLVPKQIKKFETLVQTLAEYRLNERKAQEYFADVLLKGGEQSEEAIDGLDNKLSDLMLAYQKGPGSDLSSAKDTLWGAVNAFSYLTDHVVGRGSDSRLTRAWFGSNERLKNRALQAAAQLANVVAA